MIFSSDSLVIDFMILSAVCVLPILLKRRWDLLSIGLVSTFGMSLAEILTFRGSDGLNLIVSWFGFVFLVGSIIYLMYFTFPRREVEFAREHNEDSYSMFFPILTILVGTLLRVYVSLTHVFMIVDIGRCTEYLVVDFLSGVNPYPPHPICFEYPPGMIFYYMPFIWFFKSDVAKYIFQRFITTYLKHYHLGIKVCNMFTEGVIALVLYKIGKETSSKETGLILSFLYLVHPIFLFEGYVQCVNDFPVSMFLLVSLYLLLKQRFSASAMFLGLGTAVKWVPGLALPFCLYFAGAKGRRNVVAYVVVFLIFFIAPFLTFSIVFPSFLSGMIHRRSLWFFISRRYYSWEYLLSIYRPIIPFYSWIDVLSLVLPIFSYLGILGLFFSYEKRYEVTALFYSSLAIASVFLFSRSIHRNYYIHFLPLLIASAKINRTYCRRRGCPLTDT
jgi:hypothetical protein